MNADPVSSSSGSRPFKTASLWGCVLVLGFGVSSVHGAGLWLYEQGTPDVGTAAAGMAARADDAATAFANPAGMTRLEGSQAMIGIQPIYGDFKFDTESSTFGGGSSGNGTGWIPSGGFFYVHDKTPDTKLGVSAGSYLGLGFDFNDDWAGRYYVTKNELMTAFVQGSVGHRISDTVSIGAGAGVVYGKLEYRAALNNLFDTLPDGRIKFEDTDVAFAYNFGLLFEPREDTRVGVTYISEIDLEFEDNNKIKGAGPILDGLLGLSGLKGGDTELQFTLPKQVMLSVHHQLNDDLAIMGNIGWQNWSEFGDIGVSLSNPAATKLDMDANFDDTWHYAIGARYRIDPQWSVSAGFAYDDSPVSNADRSAGLPLDQQRRYAFGLQYQARKDLTFGAAYQYMDAGDAPVNQSGGVLRGNYTGELDRSDFHFFAFNLNWEL